MITDGKSTCLKKTGKRYYKKNSFDRKVVNCYKPQVAQCKKIEDTDYHLYDWKAFLYLFQRFVNEFTETNNNGSFFASLDK